MSDTETQQPEGAPTDFPLPPASFDFLVISLKTQVEMQLGLIHLGDENESMPRDLRLARHGIDLLAVIQDKTRGNLTLEEQRLLENTVTELRFRYIQCVQESAQSKSQEQAGS